MVVGSLDPAGLTLGADDAHHLDRVLRIRPGQAVSATDGAGGRLRCVYAGSGRLEAAGEIERAERRPAPAITVAFPALKGERTEWAVQKLTEAGVDRIVIVECERSVVRWGEPGKAAHHLERLAKVAKGAVMQSRRVWVPEVVGPVALSELVSGGAAADGASPAASVVGAPLVGAPLVGGWALADPDGDPPSLEWPAVAVGPEGGWSAAERESAPALVRLGGTVLRAETAAVAAGLLLVALRDGLVRPAG